MESKRELKEIDVKNRTCYYFDDIITAVDINFIHIVLDKKLYKKITKIVMTFYTKLKRAQNHCVLGTLKFMRWVYWNSRYI